jgi:colicin import membrane protein
VLLIGGVTGGLLWKKSAEEADARAMALDAQRKAAEDEFTQLKAEFEAARKKEELLRANLASAKDEAERARIEADLASAKRQREAAGRAVQGGGKRSGSSGGGDAPAKPCNCPPGDPLCSCL